MSAAEGNIHDYLILAEEMEERDQHYASVLGIRKRAISGIEAIIEEASDSPLDKKIADDLRENIAEHDGFSDLVEDMLDALGKGFSQVELDWGRSKKRWWIEEFVRRDPRFFTFDRDTGREVRLLDEADLVNGVELEPFKWISHKAKLKSGLPIRGGLARLVAFGWICKSYTVKDWTAFIETYGLPLRLGRYGPSATAEDVEILFRAVANIGTDAAAVLPESMKIDFEGGTQGTGGDKVFENLARWTDEQTSKAVLGQTMSSDNGSSMAQAQVHNEVRHDVAKADAKSVTTTLMRDLIKPYVDLNYGVQAQYPKLKIIIEEAEDVDMVMRHTAEMVDRGMKIKQSEVRSKLGYSQPDGDDEVLVSSTAQPISTPAQKPSTKPEAKDAVAKNRALAAEQPADPYAALDVIEGELAGGWEEVMTPIISPVLALLETATTYDEALATLADAFPRMDTKPLLEALVKSAVKARALGDAGDA
jgi:phage gp29-like protein